MVRIRENAESIALYSGEPDEERRLRAHSGGSTATWWDYMKYNKRLTWLTVFYGQAAGLSVRRRGAALLRRRDHAWAC